MSEEFEKLVIERFDKIDNRLDNVDKRLDGVDKRLDGVDKRLDGVDKRLDDMYKTFDERISTMSGNIVVLEDKITKELPALYEIYSLNYQIQKENEKNIKSIEDTVNKHSIQISDLYNTIRKSS